MPYCSLMTPELLPESVTVTIAVRFSLYVFNPSSAIGSPVPPPIANIFKLSCVFPISFNLSKVGS